MEAPTKALKDATADLEKAVAALAKVQGDPDFTKTRRNVLVAALKKHRRTLRKTEASFEKFGVPIE